MAADVIDIADARKRRDARRLSAAVVLALVALWAVFYKPKGGEL